MSAVNVPDDDELEGMPQVDLRKLAMRLVEYTPEWRRVRNFMTVSSFRAYQTERNGNGNGK